MLYAVRQSGGAILAGRVKNANTYFSRMIGWIGRKRITKDDGILFRDCGAIHTCFMRFPIDLVYLDKANKVVAVRSAIKPWRIAPLHRHTRHMLELDAHAADGLKRGDQLTFAEATTCTK